MSDGTERIELCYGGMGDGQHSIVAVGREEYVFQGEQMDYVYLLTDKKTEDGYTIYAFNHLRIR